jgi:hypothetical protein
MFRYAAPVLGASLRFVHCSQLGSMSHQSVT